MLSQQNNDLSHSRQRQPCNLIVSTSRHQIRRMQYKEQRKKHYIPAQNTQGKDLRNGISIGKDVENCDCEFDLSTNSSIEKKSASRIRQQLLNHIHWPLSLRPSSTERLKILDDFNRKWEDIPLPNSERNPKVRFSPDDLLVTYFNNPQEGNEGSSDADERELTSADTGSDEEEEAEKFQWDFDDDDLEVDDASPKSETEVAEISRKDFISKVLQIQVRHIDKEMNAKGSNGGFEEADTKNGCFFRFKKPFLQLFSCGSVQTKNGFA